MELSVKKHYMSWQIKKFPEELCRITKYGLTRKY